MLAIDTETNGLDRFHGTKPFYVTTCNPLGDIKSWEADVDPYTREPQWDANDLDEIQWTLSDENPDTGDGLLFQNSKFDIQMLDNIVEIDWPWEKIFDTLYSGHLLASNQPHDLTTMALVYLGVNIKPVEEAIKEAASHARRIVHLKRFIEQFGNWRRAEVGLPEMPSAKGTCWGFDMWLPKALVKLAIDTGEDWFLPEHDGPIEEHPWATVLPEYSNPDVEVLCPLHDEHMKRLHARGLMKIYYERLKVIKVAYKMESAGVTVNKNRLDNLVDEFQTGSKRAERVCCNIAKNKYKYELNMPKGGKRNNSLVEFVFDVMKLESVGETQGGADKFDKGVLDHYLATLKSNSMELTFVENLQAIRSQETAAGYMISYRKFWKDLDDVYARLHPSLNGTGTDTLRWSSSNPNEQNISKKEKFNIRQVFGPSHNREWWSCDAQNIELRIPAYEAGETEMIELFERPDDAPYFGSYHLLIFDTLHHEKFMKHGKQSKEVYESTWYQWTKNGNFAVQYGAQESSGTADRAYHVPGAQRIIQSRFTNIAKLNQKCIDQANATGYVETIPDKEVDPTRGYPVLCTRTRWGGVKPTVPLSYHVQSTAMWWMMRAMIKCQKFLDRLNTDQSFLRSYIGKSADLIKGDRTYKMVMQVHDELVFDFPKGIGKESHQMNKPIIRECMRLMSSSGDNIGLPTPVSCKYHPDCWSIGLNV